MEKQVHSPLGTLPVGKLMLKMALPTVVAQIVNLLYNIVDRIYIGHIEGVGADALTGVGLCLPMIMMMNAFAMLGAAGGAPRAAIALGQGNKEEAERIMGNCTTLLLLFSALITTAYLLFAEPLLRLFGASDATLPYALEYMNIYSCGAVFVLLVLGLNMYLTTQGFSNFAMLTTVIGAVINIILDPILIFGLGLGVRGAAIATVLSQMVGAGWVLWFLIKGKKTILRLRAPHRPCFWPLFSAWHFRLCDDGNGGGAQHLLQFQSAALWRRYRRWLHDHHFLLLPAGADACLRYLPGLSADHQLQFWRRPS